MAVSVDQSEFAILNALPLAIVLFEADGRVLWASDCARRDLGQYDNLATALNHCTCDTRFSDWGKLLPRHAASGRAVQLLHINCHERQGQARVMNLFLSPMPNHAGRTLALVQDTSEVAELERRLAHSERLAALGKFSAQLAHELNNPLDGILRYVNLAIRLCDQLDDPRPESYLGQARRGLMRMVHIVTELLEFSRTSDAALVEDRLDHIIEEVLTSLEARASESSIKFQRRFGPNLPFIRTGNLFQVFFNLICNAIEAMPNGGTLTLTGKIVGDDVCISFADSGVGLPPGQTDRIFEPFFTTKPVGRGTGLGLAICREVLQTYHGRIKAENHPDGGAIVTVAIPLSSCQTAADVYLPRPILPPNSA